MKLTMTEYIKETAPWYGETKCDTEQEHTTKYTMENVDAFKELLKDLIDPPAYELTDDNIKNEFQYRDITPKNLEQIKKYYGYRKELYEEACADLDRIVKDGKTVRIEYEFPPDIDHFTVRELPEDQEEQYKETVLCHTFEMVVSFDA